MRYALLIEYQGTHYHGWQKQPGIVTVQETLETALSHVAAHEIKTFCAGRTDAGVHATAQVVHFDSDANRQPRHWLYGTNSYLPMDIRVLAAFQVSEDFHARFSARARRYFYIVHQCAFSSALFYQHIYWYPRLLNIAAMQQAATYLIGEHDFSAFRSSECQAHSPIRTMMQSNVWTQNEFIIFEFYANAFLHHMVRYLVGHLIEIGLGKQSPNWLKEVLENKVRQDKACTVPPQGLYLAEVQYEASALLTETMRWPWLIHKE